MNILRKQLFRVVPPVAILILAVLIFHSESHAQALRSADKSAGFLFDALCFKGKEPGLQRLDIFVVTPHESLRFVKSNEKFVAKYTTTITLRDENKKKIEEQIKERSIAADNYAASMGAGGEFGFTQSIFEVPSGSYTIEVQVEDALAEAQSKRARKLTVIDFERFPFALSSIMLANAIAQHGERFTVTPHVTDDVTPLLAEGFFAFFETYVKNDLYDSVQFAYRIHDVHKSVVFEGPHVRKSVTQGTNRLYIKVTPPANIKPDDYVLRLIAFKPGGDPDDRGSILAMTERSIRVESHLLYGRVSDEELGSVIKQLRYVADQDEIDAIESALNADVQRRSFQEFWRKNDPTPNTQRNEAYEEYYERIDYANTNFRSYTEGWLTDKGMVYVIFGPPQRSERQPYRSDGLSVEAWSYDTGREFIFVDYSSSGDFRLTRPLGPNDKYRYQR